MIIRTKNRERERERERGRKALFSPNTQNCSRPAD
jgi:hypothetical protein